MYILCESNTFLTIIYQNTLTTVGVLWSIVLYLIVKTDYKALSKVSINYTFDTINRHV